MKFLYTFGLNEDGQCGQREKKDKVLFPRLLKLSPYVEFISISAGSRHTLAITAQGAVFSWGWGQVGQLGHCDFQNASSPRRIESLQSVRVTSVSAGGMHSACLDEQHQCYSWGSNTYGQLGIGRTIPIPVSVIHNHHPVRTLAEPARNAPHLVLRDSSSSSSDVGLNGRSPSPSLPLLLRTVSCGGMHTASIDLQGDLYCWGKPDNGQIGFSDWYVDFSPTVLSPKKVPGFVEKAVDVSCGGFYTLVLMESGKVYAMGKEDFGCLGTEADRSSMGCGTEKPTLLSTFKRNPVRAIKAAGWHSLFITRNNKLFVTGKGEYGRLGLGDEASRMTPVKVVTANSSSSSSNSSNSSSKDNNVMQASGGGAHSIWCDDHNQIFTVGRLDGGRCGVGAVAAGQDRIRTARNITAHFVPGFTDIVQVEAGGSHSAVLLDYPEVTSLEQVPAFYADFDNFKVTDSL
jgi:alpha-tubulin suppressor-like RCC1 family protein